MRLDVALETALVALLLAAAPAAAFSSAPPDESPHDSITRDGAEQAGFPSGAIAALQRATTAPDYNEMEWDPDSGHVQRIDADGSFRPEHHCDRVPPTADLDAFNATVAYERSEMGAAVAASHRGEASAAMRHLGHALHAAQDCSSHSNAVDLGIDDRFPRMVLGSEAPSAALDLTGFLPGADDPEHPEGDAYPHGTYAKDSADANGEAKARLPDNRTKYEAARALAVATTRLLLAEVLAALPPAQVAALEDVEPAGGAFHDVDVPGLPPALAGGAVAVAAAWSARRR